MQQISASVFAVSGSSFQIQNFMFLSFFSDFTAWFVLDIVRNPDRFSRVVVSWKMHVSWKMKIFK